MRNKGKLQFWIKMNDGTKKNLLNGVNGLKVLADWEIHYELEKVRAFNFNVIINEQIVKKAFYFGEEKNEIQITRTLNGKTEVIYDGYINKVVPTTFYINGINHYKVDTVGSENVYFTDFVRGTTSFRNMKSYDILERLSERVAHKWEHGFEKAEVSHELKETWLDDLQIDGQYSRLFDIIKEREQATYCFGTKGKFYFDVEEKLPNGDIITEESFDITQPQVEILNDTYINSVVFKYHDLKGSLRKDVMLAKSDDADINTISDIYEVRLLTVNGKPYQYKEELSSDDETFNFADRNISVSPKIKSGDRVEIQYWHKETSGSIIVDNEEEITRQTPMREYNSRKFVMEISNDRISNKADAIELCKATLKHANKKQYSIEFTIFDLTWQHTLVTDYIDRHGYKFAFKHRVGEELIEDHIIEQQRFYPRSKVISQRIHDGCLDDGIDLKNLVMQVRLETDQSNRWQNAYIRDKVQNSRHTNKTININCNFEWDITTGCANDGIDYTLDNLTTQTVNANVADVNPKNHLEIQERIVVQEDKNATKPNEGKILCKNLEDGKHLTVNGLALLKFTMPHIYGTRWFHYEDDLMSTLPGNSDGWMTHGSDYKMVYINDANPDYDAIAKQHFLTNGSSSLIIRIYNQHDKSWYDFEQIGTKLHRIGRPKMETLYYRIPVDLNIYDKGTDTIAANWGVDTEWGFSIGGGTRRVHKIYLDPFPGEEETYLYMGHPYIPSHENTPDYTKFPEFVASVDDLSAKFLINNGKDYINLNHRPEITFDPKTCDIKKEMKVESWHDGSKYLPGNEDVKPDMFTNSPHTNTPNGAVSLVHVPQIEKFNPTFQNVGASNPSIKDLTGGK